MDMHPCFTFDDCHHGRVSDPVLTGEFFAHSLFESFSYFFHLIFFKLGIAVFFSTRHSLRMLAGKGILSARAQMRVFSKRMVFPRGSAGSVFRKHISHIRSGIPYPQMTWVNAWRIVARVAYVLFKRVNSCVKEHGYSMGLKWASINRESTISDAGSVSHPFPTFMRASYFYLSPKTNLVFFGDGGEYCGRFHARFFRLRFSVRRRLVPPANAKYSLFSN